MRANFMDILTRDRRTLLEDTAGAAVLAALLMAALYLPGLV